MSSITQIVLTLGIVVLGAVAALFTYTHLHEYSHYLIGRTQTSEIEVLYKYGIIPYRVLFQQPYDLSPTRIRLAGFAPVVTGTVLTAVFALRWGVPEYGFQSIVHFVAVGTVVLSPEDLLAVFDPEEFQRQAADGFDMTQMQILRYVLQDRS